jgi:hypothetical protein
MLFACRCSQLRMKLHSHMTTYIVYKRITPLSIFLLVEFISFFNTTQRVYW